MLGGYLNELKVVNIPKIKGGRRRKKIWLNNKATRAIKKKYRMWNAYTRNPKNEAYEKFKTARNEAVKEVREAKIRFEKKLAENIKSDAKSFFKYTRGKYTCKETIGPLRGVDRELIQDSKGMCGELNRFFASVFTREGIFDGKEGGGVMGKGDVMEELIITAEMVDRQLEKLKWNKAPGKDFFFI